MGRPYSLSLRERVVAAVRSGLSRAAAAERFRIGYSSAIRWTRRERETGSPAALPMGGKRPFTLAAELPWIEARMAEKDGVPRRGVGAAC